MARSTLRTPVVLWAITAALALVVLTPGPVSARPDPAAGLVSRPAPAPCQAADLAISVPAAIAGDPAEGMGKQAWNIVFRNTSTTACSLHGWPRIAVRTTTGKTVATTVSMVKYSNLAAIPDAEIAVPPGQSAVVTVLSATAPAGCVARWTLELSLPGAVNGSGPVTVGEPSGPLAPCVGRQLRMSPFYAAQTLTRDIKALSASAAPSPFAAEAGAEPATCATTALRAAVTSVANEHDGSIIAVRLSNAGRACALPEGWPTVRLQMTGGASQVAKIFADTAAVRAGRKLLTTYVHGTAQSTALTLASGGSVSIALFATGTGPQACHQVTSLVLYPTTAARGPGRTAALATPVRICGTARVLSFVPSGPADQTIKLARGALALARSVRVQSQSKTGFFIGTDSAAPQACSNSNGPYTLSPGNCGKGKAVPYGEYIGEVGSFWNWQGCTTSGLAWVQANYNMATDNVVKFSTGLGAAAYWFAAGPGRDPHYNGTADEAATWGRAQAQQAISDLGGKVFDFRYIFMDIENNGVSPDGDGWNTIWKGACSNKVKAEYVAPNLDFATWVGFADYIDSYSPYLAGVYSAGGDSYGSWTGIFAPEQMTNTAEWTFDNEQAQLDFPTSFSASHTSPIWFSNEQAACHLLWQWSGGNGVLNGFGDFDVANAANNASSSCAPQDPQQPPQQSPAPAPAIVHHR
jgi:Protein of unknown function (DUF4232)